MWQVRVPATSANLGSGLDTLALAVSLFMTATFEPAPYWSIEVRGCGADTVSKQRDNLVWQSADLLYHEATGHSMPNGHLVLHSDIPLGKGLGSSAAATVAGLVLANELLPDPLSQDELLQIAGHVEGHADNAAAALFGGFVMVWQNAEDQLQVRRYPAPDLSAVLAVPPYPVSTPAARLLLPGSVPLSDAVFNAQRVGLWVHAVTQRDWTVLRDASADRLHQPYRVPLNPLMQILVDAAEKRGCYAAILSGSGPTVLALTDLQHAQKVADEWRRIEKIDVFVTTLCNQGALSIPV